MIYKECVKCSLLVCNKFFKVFKSGNLSSECNKCRYKREKARRKKLEKHGPLIPADMKQCKTCKIVKSKLDFSKYIHKRDGKERIKISCKECRSADSRRLYSENREKYKDKSKRYASENKDLVANNLRVYREKNRESLKEKRAKREAERRRDIGYRLRLAMYSSIRRALVGNRSKTKMLSNIGYSNKELMDHLELQFDKNMNWNNYGTYWNVDHIVPVSIFSYRTENDIDFVRCWSLSNLRPLNIKENIKKSNELTHLI